MKMRRQNNVLYPSSQSLKGRRARVTLFAVVSCFSFAALISLRPIACLAANPHVHSPTYYLAVEEDAFQKGLIALKEDRLRAALDDFALAERERPDNALAHNFRGIVLARLARNIEAASEYREAIQIDPHMEAAYRNLGFLYWTEQQLDRAREELMHALALSPDDSFAHYYLGRVQLDAHLYADAFSEFHQSGMALPDDPDFLIAAAAGHIALDQQEDARKIIDPLATQILSATQGLRVAFLLLSVHENDTAIRLLQRLSETTPHDSTPSLNFDLALTYLEAGQYQQAIALVQPCDDAITKTSGPACTAQAWSLIGIAHARLGNAESAVHALRQAALLAPMHEEHWLNLTRELMELSRYADAISATHEGLTSNPKSYALNLRLGAANLAAGHYDEAAKVFRTLIAAGDPLPTSSIGLAQILLRSGHAEEAVTDLADARQRLGPSFLLSYFQGLALDRAGRLSEAISAFQEAVQLNPNSAEAHLELGKTELVQGSASDAIVQLQETLRLSPGNVQALRLLSQAYRRTGDKRNSVKYAEAPEAARVADGDLLGDFLLPQWQNPPEKRSVN